MKKLTNSGFAGIAAAALLAAGALVPSANAQVALLSTGDYTIYVDGYTADNFYGADGKPATGAPGAVNLGAAAVGGIDSFEDTWGIFQITKITQVGSLLNKYTEGGPENKQYWGVLYGSYDTGFDITPQGNLEATSLGLKIDIYQRNVGDFGDVAWIPVAQQGVGGRIGANGYTGISDLGTKVLSASLSGSMESFFSPDDGASHAFGNLSVAPGQTLLTGLSSPVTTLHFDIGGLTSQVRADWDLKVTGVVDSIVPVPEPSTYGLISAGALLGLVAYRRMKVRASAV